jgi:hypothetical protein
VKHFDVIAFSAVIALLVAVGLYMLHAPPVSVPPPRAAPDSSITSFARFCRGAGLVPKAVEDCDAQMAAAKSDDDRRRIERLFTFGAVRAARPSP